MIIKKRNQKSGEVKRVQQESIQQVAPIQVEETEGFNEANSEIESSQEFVQPVVANVEPEEPDFDLFDIENIDFAQRQERRRGSRRRGYRRIDDRNLVSRAEEESENIKKSAFEEGYRIGLEKAQADVDKFKHELSNFMNAKKDVFEYIAPDLLEISVMIAKKIIKKELATDPQIIIDTILDVLKTVSKNEPKITIKVRPQSVQFIKDTLPSITYQYGIDSKINIVADPSIEEGGCVLQTNNGIVDASIDTQLEIIKKTLEIN